MKQLIIKMIPNIQIYSDKPEYRKELESGIVERYCAPSGSVYWLNDSLHAKYEDTLLEDTVYSTGDNAKISGGIRRLELLSMLATKLYGDSLRLVVKGNITVIKDGKASYLEVNNIHELFTTVATIKEGLPKVLVTKQDDTTMTYSFNAAKHPALLFLSGAAIGAALALKLKG